jgi:L-malate glycosyltransferase
VRVLQVDAGREWRGGQNQVRLLTRELARSHPQHLEQRLATRRGGLLADRAAREGVSVVPIPWSAGLDPRAWWQLRGLIRTFDPDIVHVHDSHALTLVRAVRRGPRPGPRRSPFRLVAHRRVDFHVRRGSAWLRADSLIAVSDAVRRVLLSDGADRARITVIPDGVDAEEIRTRAATPFGIRDRLALPAGTPLAVNVAALVDHKDQRTLIRAAAHARARAASLHWVIAGEGVLRPTLERDIREQDVADRVHLLGYIQEIDALIAEADVFVMSSKEEGMGSVILDALALGIPVVATAAGGIPEVLPANHLAPIGDAAGLAARVIEAITHPSAPLPFPPKFTAATMAQATMALYQRLV